MKAADFTANSPGHLEPIPEGVRAFVPDPLPPPKINFSECCQLAEEAAFSLGGLRELVDTLPNSNLLIDSFMRREAVRSSHIEGTRTQLGQLLLFELGEDQADSVDPVDAEQVERNYRAFKRGVTLVDKIPVGGKLFREIHEVLFEGANPLEKAPGKFRKASALIGREYTSLKEAFENARFVPTPAPHIEAAMKDLDEFINLPERHAHLPSLIQLALMHYQFEAIHPFMDGNGRIGRLAVSLLLKQRGTLPEPVLCLSAYMDERREAYVDAMLAVSQRGDWVPWVSFFLQGVKDQATEDARRCKNLLKLHNEYQEFCNAEGIPYELARQLFVFPITTNARVAELLDVSPKTGSRYVEVLQRNGKLAEVTGRQTHRIYLAQPVIDLLEKPLE